MKKFIYLLSLFLLFPSCDPEVLVPVDMSLAKVDPDEMTLAFENIFITPIKMDFTDKLLLGAINKIAIKNINNYTDLNVFFAEGSLVSNVDHFTLDVKVFKNKNYDIEFRLFENKFHTLVYKKFSTNIRKRGLISEVEKQLRQIFKIQIYKYKPGSKVSFNLNEGL